MQFGPGFFPTFLYYFSSTGLVFALVMMAATGASLASGLPQEVGLVGGLLGGLVGAYFNRTMLYTLPVNSEKKFWKSVEETLTKLGYIQTAEEDGVRVYQRSGLSKYLSGRVFVTVEGQEAAIASRAVQIRSLKKLLST
ncbi:MAG TPA: hypothetical protein IGS37_13305 [Synechococcales cyanobacterium M55_K2018_004]|nr:hypothetical protein [Synechococcales cyanobacterium M55_K2018_004]